MFIRSGTCAALFGTLVFLVGCSDNQTAEVAGTVTVDGQPAEKGAISFIPADGKGPTAGGEITAGKYIAKNVPIGTATVQIRVSKVMGKKKLYNTPESPYQDWYGEALPKKFNDATELRFDVKPGNNEKNWDLPTH
jgi:hypothetical protein